MNTNTAKFEPFKIVFIFPYLRKLHLLFDTQRLFHISAAQDDVPLKLPRLLRYDSYRSRVCALLHLCNAYLLVSLRVDCNGGHEPV